MWNLSSCMIRHFTMATLHASLLCWIILNLKAFFITLLHAQFCFWCHEHLSNRPISKCYSWPVLLCELKKSPTSRAFHGYTTVHCSALKKHWGFIKNQGLHFKGSESNCLLTVSKGAMCESAFPLFLITIPMLCIFRRLIQGLFRSVPEELFQNAPEELFWSAPEELFNTLRHILKFSP